MSPDVVQRADSCGADDSAASSGDDGGPIPVTLLAYVHGLDKEV